MSSSSVRGVLIECAIRPNCVADSSNNVWCVVSGSVLCWENVFWYDVGSLFVCVFVILKTLLFRLCDWGEVGGGCVICFGYVFTEVGDWLFAEVYSDDRPAAAVRFL